MAAHGRLYATELVEEDQLKDYVYSVSGTLTTLQCRAHANRARTEMGERIVVLSAGLEVLHVFRGVDMHVPGPYDFWQFVPRGETELILVNFDH